MSVRELLLVAILVVGAVTVTACADAPHPRVIGYGSEYHSGGHD